MPTLIEIQSKIQALQQQAEELRQTEFQQVLIEVKEKIELYGITPRDLGFTGKTEDQKRAPQKVAPRYRKGDMTWTGRGKSPRWVTDHIEAGGALEDLLIKSS